MKLDFRSAVSGCILLVISLFHAQSHAQVAPDPEFLTMYGGMDCENMRNEGPRLTEVFKLWDSQPRPYIDDRAVDPWPEIVAERQQKKLAMRAALAQVLREKQCDNPQAAAQPAVTARTGAPAQVPAAPPAAGMLPQIGAKVDVVSPGFAQSLGLKQAGGALVIETEAGSPAQLAGLQALDVIVEITGQRVQSPADLQKSLSRMRPGFKAALRVWRNKGMRDVIVEIAAGPPIAQVPAMASPAPAAIAQTVVPQPSAAEAGAYCYAMAALSETIYPTFSRPYRVPYVSGDFDEKLMRVQLAEFTSLLVARDPSRYKPIPNGGNAMRCQKNVAWLTCAAFIGSSPALQINSVICGKADDKSDFLSKLPPHQVVEWPVKR